MYKAFYKKAFVSKLRNDTLRSFDTKTEPLRSIALKVLLPTIVFLPYENTHPAAGLLSCVRDFICSNRTTPTAASDYRCPCARDESEPQLFHRNVSLVFKRHAWWRS